MLKRIHIRNFAIIESIDIEWTAGLNVLTGETGAGKSILFDALSIVLGARSSPSFIRPGSNRAYIEASFEPGPEVIAWLKHEQLIDADLAELVVSREITRSGSRARINGILINNSMLTELRQMLLTFHAQHEIRTLLSSSTQLALLDGLGSKSHLKLLDRYRTEFARYSQVKAELAEHRISASEKTRRLEFARFQYAELVDAQLEDANEDARLAEQKGILDNAHELEQAVSEASSLLVGDNDYNVEPRGSALTLIQNSIAALAPVTGVDKTLLQASDLLATSLANAEEAAYQLRRYGDSIDTDTESLERLEERIGQLASTKRKYGPTLADALNIKNQLEDEIEKLSDSSNRADQLAEELEKLDASVRKLAAELSGRRQKTARELEQGIHQELAGLGMEKARFRIDRQELEEPTSDGMDRLEFLITANRGQPLRPLSKIASGGELSRIMLALKTIFARSDKVATVIFDEIDTGMSGRVLSFIREKLAKLARSHQILCITHQPMIASIADNHIAVCKEQSDDKTVITAETLAERERLKSLASMASGNEDETASLSFASSLLAAAEELKSRSG